MRKMKSKMVLWIILIGLLFFSTMMMQDEYADPVMNKRNQEEITKSQEQAAENNLGMYVLIPTKPGEKVTVYDMVYANTQGKVVSIFIAIYAVLFATADMKSGFIKNIGGQVKKRYALIFSKAVLLIWFTMETFFIVFATQVISNIISFGYLEIGPPIRLCGYIGLQMLLHSALALITMSISILIMSNVISMVIAVCMCMNLTIILYGFFNKFLENILGKTIDIVQYTVTGQISRIGINWTESVAEKGMITAVLYGTAFLILAAVIFKERDIR